jgi:hypothetical protein
MIEGHSVSDELILKNQYIDTYVDHWDIQVKEKLLRRIRTKFSKDFSAQALLKLRIKMTIILSG